VNSLLTRCRCVLADESGQALVLASVCLFTLMGVMALAVDVGNLRFKQQQLQGVADAAALAGALELSTCGSTSHCSAMQTAAQSAVTENGLSTPTVVTQCGTSTGTGVILQVNNGPCALGTNDPNNGNAQYVEAVVIEKQNTFLGVILGTRQITLTARSEAMAVGGSGSSACVYVGSLALNSDASMTMTCGIQDNGSIGVDSGSNITTTPSFVYGGAISYNNCGTSGQTVWTGGNCTFKDAAPKSGSSVSDPLAYLTAPTQPATSTTNTQTPSSGATLQPGYYPNGFNLNSNVSVTLSPGVYYMGGSIDVDGGASLVGSGVTLYFTSGNLQINSDTATVQLTAPTASTNGTNAGVVIWESSSNSSGMTIDSNSSSYFQGAIYFPNSNAGLTLNSASNVTAAYTIIDIGGQLTVDSSETFTINNNYSSLPNGSPLKGGGSATAALAE
jgi:Flp pilus assembly protein TadG